MTYVSKTARFTFSTYVGAVEGLIIALEDARTTTKRYQITGLSAGRIIREGLLVEGDIDEVSEKLALISGATRHDF